VAAELQIPATVEQLIHRFDERYASRNKSGAATTGFLRRYVLPAWGPRPIGSVKRADVVALLDAIVDEGKPFAANRCFAAIRRMYSWAVERSYLETSPCYGVKAPTKEASRERVL